VLIQKVVGCAVFITQLLEFRVALRRIARPVNVKPEHAEGHQDEQPSPRAQAAVGRRGPETFAYVRRADLPERYARWEIASATCAARDQKEQDDERNT